MSFFLSHEPDPVTIVSTQRIVSVAHGHPLFFRPLCNEHSVRHSETRRLDVPCTVWPMRQLSRHNVHETSVGSVDRWVGRLNVRCWVGGWSFGIDQCTTQTRCRTGWSTLLTLAMSCRQVSPRTHWLSGSCNVLVTPKEVNSLHRDGRWSCQRPLVEEDHFCSDSRK